MSCPIGDKALFVFLSLTGRWSVERKIIKKIMKLNFESFDKINNWNFFSLLQRHELTKKVEVSIIIEGPEGNLDAEASLRQLMVLLGMERFSNYEFDTPPQTPEPSKREFSNVLLPSFEFSFTFPLLYVTELQFSGELVEPQKVEPRVTDDFTCRHCGALTDQPAVRQTAHQLGIVDHVILLRLCQLQWDFMHFIVHF